MPNQGKEQKWQPSKPPSQPSPTAITWLLVSRIAALLIVFSLLIAFLAAAALGRTLDSGVVVAFLSIAFALLFGPAAGYYFVVRKNGNGGSSE